MKYLILFLFSLSILNSSFAQDIKPVIAIDKFTASESNYNPKRLSQKLSSRLKSDFEINQNAFFVLSGDISFGEPVIINGMDSYTTSTANIKYQISAINTAPKTISLDIKCKGKSERDLQNKLGTTLIRNRKHIEALNAFIRESISTTFSNCEAINTAIQEQLNDNQNNRAFAMLNYYDSVENCETAKSNMEDQNIKNHQNYVCDKIIHDSKILANSAEVRKLNQATDLLLLIPPDAPCADEALTISELINKNAVALKSEYSVSLQERISKRNTMTQQEWKHWYRKNYKLIKPNAVSAN